MNTNNSAKLGVKQVQGRAEDAGKAAEDGRETSACGAECKADEVVPLEQSLCVELFLVGSDIRHQM